MPPKKKTTPNANTVTPPTSPGQQEDFHILYDLEENFDSFKDIFNLVSYGNLQILRFIRKYHEVWGKDNPKELMIVNKFKNIINHATEGNFNKNADFNLNYKMLAEMSNSIGVDLSTSIYLANLYFVADKSKTLTFYLDHTTSNTSDKVGSLLDKDKFGRYFEVVENMPNQVDCNFKEVFKDLNFKDMFNGSSFGAKITFKRIYTFYKTFIPNLSKIDLKTWIDDYPKIVDGAEETGLDSLANKLKTDPQNANNLYFVLLLIISVHLTLIITTKLYLHNTVMYFFLILCANVRDMKTLQNTDAVQKAVKGLYDKFGKKLNLTTYGFLPRYNAIFESIADVLDKLESKKSFEDIMTDKISDEELMKMDNLIARLFVIYF